MDLSFWLATHLVTGYLHKMTDWTPYRIGTPGRLRPLHTPEGLGDRLRFVAFAERQAAQAFSDAVLRYPSASSELKEAWRWVAQEERKHESWLLERLRELGQDVAGEPVSLDLYRSFEQCQSAREFALFMADAEARGQVAGERFGDVLRVRDPQSAEVFAQIAREEREHVALVGRFFS